MLQHRGNDLRAMSQSCDARGRKKSNSSVESWCREIVLVVSPVRSDSLLVRKDCRTEISEDEATVCESLREPLKLSEIRRWRGSELPFKGKPN